MTMKVIGLTGQKGAGKTLVASIIKGKLEERGVTAEVLSFATPLKECVQLLMDFTGDQLYSFEGKEAIDERYGVSPRLVLQKFGTEFVRKVVPDLWLYKMDIALRESTADVILVDDIRFNDEAQLILKFQPGVAYRITGRPAQKKGFLAYSKRKLFTHSSERSVAMKFITGTLPNTHLDDMWLAGRLAVRVIKENKLYDPTL